MIFLLTGQTQQLLSVISIFFLHCRLTCQVAFGKKGKYTAMVWVVVLWPCSTYGAMSKNIDAHGFFFFFELGFTTVLFLFLPLCVCLHVVCVCVCVCGWVGVCVVCLMRLCHQGRHVMFLFCNTASSDLISGASHLKALISYFNYFVRLKSAANRRIFFFLLKWDYI